MYSSEKYSDIGKQLGITTHQVARWHREFIEKDTGWVKQIKFAPVPGSDQAEPMAVEIELNFSCLKSPISLVKVYHKMPRHGTGHGSFLFL